MDKMAQYFTGEASGVPYERTHKVEFSSTLRGIHYKILHAATVVMEAFRTTVPEKCVCSYCREKYPEKKDEHCCVCISEQQVDHGKGDHDLHLRIEKPWVERNVSDCKAKAQNMNAHKTKKY